jgi:hypothetical protein
MFSKISKHLSYANVAATLALVFAMTGGAYALNTHGGSSGGRGPNPTSALAAKSKAKAKAKAPARGPAGPQGKIGPAGPAGPAGAQGAKGENGTAGTNGTDGTDGTNGTNGEPGKEGKAGKEGKEGKTGFTKTLPAGATETGVWSVSGGPISYRCVTDTGKGEYEESECLTAAATSGTGNFEREPINHNNGLVFGAISFSIPLEKSLASECDETGKPACPVHYLKLGQTSTECPSTEAQIQDDEPKAAPGNLCVYERQSDLERAFISTPGVGFQGFTGEDNAGTTGATLIGEAKAGHDPAFAFGSWAVTAPAA